MIKSKVNLARSASDDLFARDVHRPICLTIDLEYLLQASVNNQSTGNLSKPQDASRERLTDEQRRGEYIMIRQWQNFGRMREVQ